MPKKNEILEQVENIVTQSLDDLISDRFASYAKYVIQNRAIPDVNDGLKPVQRRIIYSMYQNGFTFDKPTRKSAKIVGNVIGNFHPHGDSSVYEALCRMSQTWKTNEPLIDFQGNNGSIDGDPPAHQRYTEAKLSKIANLLVKNLEKKVVDFQLNYSDEELEPIVLPSYIPNLFLNGTEGIAVSLATKIPPHNLSELLNATIYRIKNPECSLDELLEIVKGPDLPTGGIIYNTGGIREMYETGHGSFDISSKIEIEENKDCNRLIIKEIPYEVNKQKLVYSIDEIRKNKVVDGIIDVKDLSSGDDINIVIDVKKEINPLVVKQYLLNKTQLQVSFSANIVAICTNHPQTLSLISYLDFYINHLIDITTMSYQYDLKKDTKRYHIIEGLIKAISIIDEIVELIRKSTNKDDARTKLIDNYDFSYEQAEAILNIRLYRLSNTDVNIYINEKEQLEKSIKNINAILNSRTKLKNEIVKELENIDKDFGKPRKTEIFLEQESISLDKRDLLTREDFYVSITHDGYVKRSSIKSFRASESRIPGLKEGDYLVFSNLVSNLDYILCFTNLGNFLYLPVHELPELKWKDEGKHINFLINLPLNEYIIKTIIVKDFSKDVSIALLSKNGQIKKTALQEFNITRYSKPVQCMKLVSGDEVADVSVLNNNSNILVITELGLGSYFNENDIAQTGLKTSGVKSISTRKGANMKSLLSFRNDEKAKLVFITDQAMYRVFDSSNLTLTARLGATQYLFKSFKSSVHKLIYTIKLKEKVDELNLDSLLKDNSIFNFKIDDLHLTPMDKYCKRNINLEESKSIKNIMSYSCQVIDENTLVEEKKNVEKVDNNEENEDLSSNSSNQKSIKNIKIVYDEVDEKDEKDEEHGYEQISIFDDMGD